MRRNLKFTKADFLPPFSSLDLKVKIPLTSRSKSLSDSYCILQQTRIFKTVDSATSEPKAKKTKNFMKEPKPWKHLLPRALTDGLSSQFSKLTLTSFTSLSLPSDWDDLLPLNLCPILIWSPTCPHLPSGNDVITPTCGSSPHTPHYA